MYTDRGTLYNLVSEEERDEHDRKVIERFEKLDNTTSKDLFELLCAYMGVSKLNKPYLDRYDWTSISKEQVIQMIDWFEEDVKHPVRSKFNALILLDRDIGYTNEELRDKIENLGFDMNGEWEYMPIVVYYPTRHELVGAFRQFTRSEEILMYRKGMSFQDICDNIKQSPTPLTLNNPRSIWHIKNRFKREETTVITVRVKGDSYNYPIVYGDYYDSFVYMSELFETIAEPYILEDAKAEMSYDANRDGFLIYGLNTDYKFDLFVPRHMR